MSVHAFRMQLKPGNIDEYRRRHDAIWPELSELLSASGIYDSSTRKRLRCSQCSGCATKTTATRSPIIRS
jgi:hypothetical protein